jgi:hypothetical protein
VQGLKRHARNTRNGFLDFSSISAALRQIFVFDLRSITPVPIRQAIFLIKGYAFLPTAPAGAGYIPFGIQGEGQ